MTAMCITIETAHHQTRKDVTMIQEQTPDWRAIPQRGRQAQAQRSGKEPLPTDPIIRAFDESDDAHEYCFVRNEAEQRIPLGAQQEEECAAQGYCPRCGEVVAAWLQEDDDTPLAYRREDMPCSSCGWNWDS